MYSTQLESRATACISDKTRPSIKMTLSIFIQKLGCCFLIATLHHTKKPHSAWKKRASPLKL